MTPGRHTAQRGAILTELERAREPLTAQELHRRLTDHGCVVGLATVYRNLGRLAEEGIADTLATEAGEHAFLLCGQGHHHHLRCRRCGRVEEIRDCALDDWTRSVARRHGYSDVEHVAELLGTCPACARRPEGRTRSSAAGRRRAG